MCKTRQDLEKTFVYVCLQNQQHLIRYKNFICDFCETTMCQRRFHKKIESLDYNLDATNSNKKFYRQNPHIGLLKNVE